ncbi:hypothetical protein niasHT_030529 [Heterodera trifolii]|uniref:C2H2-type domain-containing protein n=1 Tax=Heterodera trifolii TaxID=157864 RepID=A0ABD2IYY6_9BILA
MSSSADSIFELHQSFNDTMWPASVGGDEFVGKKDVISWWKKLALWRNFICILLLISLLGLLFLALFINERKPSMGLQLIELEKNLAVKMDKIYEKLGQQQESLLIATDQRIVHFLLLAFLLIAVVYLIILLIKAIVDQVLKQKLGQNNNTTDGEEEKRTDEKEETEENDGRGGGEKEGREEEAHLEENDGEEEEEEEEEKEGNKREEFVGEKNDEEEEEEKEEWDGREAFLEELEGATEEEEEEEEEEEFDSEEEKRETEEKTLGGKKDRILQQPATKSKKATKGRRFSCTLCTKSFDRHSNLKRHVLIHTGEKPLGANFVTRHLLKRVILTLIGPFIRATGPTSAPNVADHLLI